MSEEYVITKKENLVTIADAIRGKTGSSDNIIMNNMPKEVSSIKTIFELTELDALSALMETNTISPIADKNEAIYINSAGNIYTF